MENQIADEAFGFKIDGRGRDDYAVTGVTVTSISFPDEPTNRGDVASVPDGPRSFDVVVISTSANDGMGLVGGDDPRPSDVVTDCLRVPDVPDVPSASPHRAERPRSSVMFLTPILDRCLETSGIDAPMRTTRPRDLDDPLAYPEGLISYRDITEGLMRPSVGGLIPLNDEDPNIPPGRADVSPCSSSSDSQASSDDEDTLDEVQQTKKAKKAKKKAKVKVRPNPHGSSLSDARSLQRLRRKCGISEEIVLVASSPADRADAPPPGYMTRVLLTELTPRLQDT
ncbi:hypothetical protein AALP_AA3G343300 [Arabis alpina]|uniref:Uncharacterized protein n=1 Tax=Arabis alpina TaxID=50452 RepID=A0A087HDK0_ARAAL|nr:hypothetical protein AALP_AA3G343300 [Arabis alpina]